MRLPDFLIIGAMKSGTTTLYAQLAAQNGVFMPALKEPNFFSDNAVYSQGLGWYTGLFQDAPEGACLGEASTHYTKLPTYPETVARLANVLPSPKLVYVLRDPVRRAVSQYLHEWSKREVSGDISSAFNENPRLVEYSCYGKQIAPYVEAFGASAVHLTSLERLRASPAEELAAIGAHIRAPEPLEWQSDIAAQNQSGERWRRLPFQRTLVDNPVAEFARRKLIPKSIRTRVREARRVEATPELPEPIRTRIERVFIEDRARLAAMFPGHPVLADAYPFAAP
ncbi:MAG: sulfotransferase domain-containing protein [Pseudomonadota bacterium]